MASSSERYYSRRKLKDYEEEEVNRRLKEANLYNHLDSFEDRKKIAALLEPTSKPSDSKKPPFTTTKNESKSFEDSFNIVDDNSEVEAESNNLSNNRDENKSPTSDDEEALPLGKTTKTRPDRAQGLLNVNKPGATYGNKMLSASLKKSGGTDDLVCNNSSLNQEELLEPSNKKVKFFSTRKASMLKTGNSSLQFVSSQKRAPTSVAESSDDDDFFPSLNSKVAVNSNSVNLDHKVQSASSLAILPVFTKMKLSALVQNVKKYEKMLKITTSKQPNPLPTSYDFCSRGSYEKLVEEERNLSTKSDSEPIKWRKPIILNTSNNRKRCPPSNPSSKGNSPDKELVTLTDPHGIICDSPPTSSLRKFDSSSRSPILEPRNFRSKSGDTKNSYDSDVEFEFEQKTSKGNKLNEPTQECPVCSKFFPSDTIAFHASGCFGFEIEESNSEPQPRQRSQRIATRFYRTQTNQQQSVSKGVGSDDEAGSSNPFIVEECHSGKDDSESEFENDEDSKLKRNRKRGLVTVKKRRL